MHSIPQRISSLSIKTKMLAGFGCVLVILVGVAASAYLRFLGVAGSFGDYAQRVSVVSVSRDIDRDFSELRRHVREFALVGTVDDATAAMTLSEEVKREIDQGLALIANPERRKRIQDIQARFAGYRKNVDTVFALRRDQDKLVHDTMDPVGVAAGGDFDSLIASSSKGGATDLTILAFQGQQALMQLRLNANKVIDRQHDTEDAKRAEQAEADLTRLMGQLDGATVGSASRNVFDTLRQRASTYALAYRQAVHLNSQLTDL